MTAKSVLLRPQDLRTRARAPTPCYATDHNRFLFYAVQEFLTLSFGIHFLFYKHTEPDFWWKIKHS